MVVDAIEYSRTMSAVHLVGSRRETAAEFGDSTRLLGKRDDNASFVAYIFPYKHDRREYIVGIGN